MRAKGLAASGVIVNAIGFVNQFAGPIALGNIGYRYIYVFVGWDCVEALLWYRFGYVLLAPVSSLVVDPELKLLPVSRPRDAHSSSSSGYTTNQVPSRRHS